MLRDILVISLYFLPSVSASPLPFYESLSLRAFNITAQIPSAWVGEPNGRGTEGLILSCFTTLFLCAWTAYHPNVPPKKSSILYFIQRVTWLLLAMFLPEMVLYRAWDQWWAASILTREVNKVLQTKADGAMDTNASFWGQSSRHPCIGIANSSRKSDRVNSAGGFYPGNAPVRRYTDPGCGRYSTLNQRHLGSLLQNQVDQGCPSLYHVGCDGSSRLSNNDVQVSSVKDASADRRANGREKTPTRTSGIFERTSIRSRASSNAIPSVVLPTMSDEDWYQNLDTTIEDEVEEAEKAEPWTTTQSLFVISGGVAIDATSFYRKPRLTLTPEGILRLAQVDLLPKISKEDVDDKSKADAFAKIVVCTQAIWFIVQCFARVASGLPLTLLEVHTMTHIACALTMYAIWFKKPYGVESPIYCDDERVVNFSALLAAGGDCFPDTCIPQCSAQHDINNINAARWATITDYESQGETRNLLSLLRRADKAIRDLRERGIHYKWEVDNRGVIDLGTSLPITDPTHYLSEVMVEGRLDDSEDTWAPIHVQIAIVLFSGLYGGSHLSAWGFHFPTAGEMWAWRACSIAMAALPVLGLVGWVLRQLELWGVGWYAPSDAPNDAPSDAPGSAPGSAPGYALFRALGLFPSYAPSDAPSDASSASSEIIPNSWKIMRLILLLLVGNLLFYIRMYILGESLASLRSPAPGTYDTVDWTSFLPHFF